MNRTKGMTPLSDPERRAPRADLPVGVEKVLYLAATDPAFRQAFMADREAAIEARGLRLRPSELAVLKLAPADQLALAIDKVDVSEAAIARRGFMRAVAATAVTIAAGEALGACQTRGIQPDYDGGDQADAADASSPTRGIQPDYDGGDDAD